MSIRLDQTVHRKKQIAQQQAVLNELEDRYNDEFKKAREKMHEAYNEFVKKHEQLHRDEIKDLEMAYNQQYNKEKHLIMEEFQKIETIEKNKIPSYQKQLISKVVND